MRILKHIGDFFLEIIKMIPGLLVGLVLGGITIYFTAYKQKQPTLAVIYIVSVMIVFSFVAVGLGFSKGNKKTEDKGI
jgi:hypothetical protein